MHVVARAAESLQPGETTGFQSLSGATERATLAQRGSCPAGSPDQATAYGLMPSQASPESRLKLSPSASQTWLWSGSTWLRMALQVPLSNVAEPQKKITGLPW